MIVAAVGAIGVELVRERGRTSGDLALALLFYGGIAGGVVLVGLSDGSSANLDAVPVRLADHHVARRTWPSSRCSARSCWRRCWCCGRRSSRSATTRSTPGSSGLPVRTLNLLLAVTTAVTVTIAMRAVGLLLVSALMVVPVAAAQQVTRGFRTTMTAAMVIGVFAAGGRGLARRPGEHRARRDHRAAGHRHRSWPDASAPPPGGCCAAAAQPPAVAGRPAASPNHRTWCSHALTRRPAVPLSDDDTPATRRTKRPGSCCVRSPRRSGSRSSPSSARVNAACTNWWRSSAPRSRWSRSTCGCCAAPVWCGAPGAAGRSRTPWSTSTSRTSSPTRSATPGRPDQ